MPTRNRFRRPFPTPRAAACGILVSVTLVSCATSMRDVGEFALPDQFHVYYQTIEEEFDNRQFPSRGFDGDGSSVSLGLSWNLSRPAQPERGLPREDLLWLLQELRAAEPRTQPEVQPTAQATPASAPVEEPPVQEPPPPEVEPAVVEEAAQEIEPPPVETSEPAEVAVVPDSVVDEPPPVEPPIEEPPIAEPAGAEVPAAIGMVSPVPPTLTGGASTAGTKNPWLFPALAVSAAGLAALLAVKLAPRAAIVVAKLTHRKR